MTQNRPKLIAGNWKMNGNRAALSEIDAIIEAPAVEAELLICPPFPLVPIFADRAIASPLAIGAQDCHPAESGAHTGDVSATLLRGLGARAVIVGHSERRADHGESDELVRRKAEAGLGAGLEVIICVGETQIEREAGNALSVARSQLEGSLPDTDQPQRITVAYEPVWAIGTGLVPQLSDIEEMHAAIKAALKERFGEAGEMIRVLYGGSVKPANAAEIFAVSGVDGALIGGASLKAVDFLAIASAA